MTVFVEAIHTVKPLTNTIFDRWVEWYGNEVIPAMRRNGYDLLGAWKRTGGEMGQDVLLSRFENLGAYEKASASLRQDAGFLKALRATGDFIVSETVKAVAPVPYATEQRLERQLAERPEKPRQYLQAVLQLKAGGQPKAFEVVGRLADTVEASGFMSLATGYETTVGLRGELTDIWVYGKGMPNLGYRPGDPLAEIFTALREVAPEESTYYLNPLPYSPLQ